MTHLSTTAVVGAKGGVGTSTIASVLAILTSRHAATTLVDLAPGLDCSTILSVLPGLPDDPGPVHVAGGLHLYRALRHQGTRLASWATLRDVLTGFSGALVVDAGTFGSRDADQAMDLADRTVVVFRNDYLSLRRLVNRGLTADMALVMIQEPDRALNVQDAIDTLGHPVIVVRHDPKVARANDAGLLPATDLPNSFHQLVPTARIAARAIDKETAHG